MAVAGKGGVASSRPVATAVVGDGGLAIANPVATAIAGISLEEADELGIPIKKSLGTKAKNFAQLNLPLKGRYGLTETMIESNVGLLVGPEYQAESRISESEIQAEIDDRISKLKNATDLINNDSYDKNDQEIMAESDEIPFQDMKGDKVKEFPLAIAPEQILPNQYPLIPPNYGPLFNFGRLPWNPEQFDGYPGYYPVPFDQSLLQDRSVHSMSGYDDTIQVQNPNIPMIAVYRQAPNYGPYPYYFYQ